MQNIRKIIVYLVILATLLATGFYRDFLFKKINALLQAWDHDMDYLMPDHLRFFENYEYDTIVHIKWILTFVFSLLYLAIAVFTIRYLFRQKKQQIITIVTYIAIMGISGCFILIGILLPSSSEKAYEFARYFMGMAQSPIVLMILIPLFKLSEKEKDNHRLF